MEIGENILVYGEWGGHIVGRKDNYYQVKDEDNNVFDVDFWLVRSIEDYKIKLQGCDYIEVMLNMLRKTSLTEEEQSLLNEIEDFSINYMGED